MCFCWVLSAEIIPTHSLPSTLWHNIWLPLAQKLRGGKIFRYLSNCSHSFRPFGSRCNDCNFLGCSRGIGGKKAIYEEHCMTPCQAEAALQTREIKHEHSLLLPLSLESAIWYVNFQICYCQKAVITELHLIILNNTQLNLLDGWHKHWGGAGAKLCEWDLYSLLLFKPFPRFVQ